MLKVHNIQQCRSQIEKLQLHINKSTDLVEYTFDEKSHFEHNILSYAVEFKIIHFLILMLGYPKFNKKKSEPLIKINST
jgi:hypothetical protein